MKREKEQGITPDAALAKLSEAVIHSHKGGNIMVELITRLLGLDVCIETVVGNDLLKGISGGQKRRVTSGGPPQCVRQRGGGGVDVCALDDVQGRVCCSMDGCT